MLIECSLMLHELDEKLSSRRVTFARDNLSTEPSPHIILNHSQLLMGSSYIHSAYVNQAQCDFLLSSNVIGDLLDHASLFYAFAHSEDESRSPPKGARQSHSGT